MDLGLFITFFAFLGALGGLIANFGRLTGYYMV
jgi:hypothetical protein